MIIIKLIIITFKFVLGLETKIIETFFVWYTCQDIIMSFNDILIIMHFN